MADIDSSLEAAEQARIAGDAARAEQICRQVLAVAPRDPRALVCLTRALEEAVRLAPDSPTARFRLGELLEGQGDAAGAGRQFAEALRLAPDNVDAALRLAQTLFSQGKLGEAEAQFAAV